MSVRKCAAAAAVAFASLALAATANAAVYNFSFNADNGTDKVIGEFTTDAAGQVVGATGKAFLSVLDSATCCGFVNNVISLDGGNSGPPYNTPSGAYIVDNQYPVDSYGLFLTTFGGREINIFSDTVISGPSGIISDTIAAGQGPRPAWIGIFDNTKGIDAQEYGSMTITAVPELATWAMMLVGLGGVGAVLRSNRRSSTITA
jgi:hypothetical protein